MKEKVSYALKKSKIVLIIALVLWIFFSIVLIAPLSIAWVDTVQNGDGGFIEELINTDFGNVFTNLGTAFSSEYVSNTLKCELWLGIIIIGIAIIGIIKTMPKHDYAGIENGSSDWAEGEQYAVLSRTKGILLAEKHYLPVNKRGNVNVLVVGRFRFW